MKFSSTYVLRLRCFCYIETFPLHVIFGAAYESLGLEALAFLGAVNSDRGILQTNSGFRVE